MLQFELEDSFRLIRYLNLDAFRFVNLESKFSIYIGLQLSPLIFMLNLRVICRLNYIFGDQRNGRVALMIESDVMGPLEEDHQGKFLSFSFSRYDLFEIKAMAL